MAPSRRIRWDRVGRFALLFVALLMVWLYVNPVRTWWTTWHEAKERRVQVAELRRENRKLRVRRERLRDPHQLEREARKLGMVKAGERPFVVRGLPRGE